MRLDNLLRNLRVLWRADSIIADIHIRHHIARTGLVAIASTIAIFSLLMFDLAAFLALQNTLGPAWSAIVLGIINLAIALLLAVLASLMKPSRELKLATEVHRTALEAVTSDLRSVESDFQNITNSLRHPFDSAITGAIIPLTSLLLKTLRKTDRPKPNE